MPFIAERVRRTKPSASSMASQRARDLQAAGKDIIRLTAGEPDFETPDHVKAAVTEAMARGETRYMPIAGAPKLKEAIAAKFKRENDLDYPVAQIMVANGGKQIIFNALMATVEAGDEVIVAAPYWVSYPDMTQFAGGTPVVLTGAPEDGFKLRPEQLAAAITPRTKWLILNSPCNPSGATYSHDEMTALCEVLLRHPQVHVLSDDIYEHIRYDGARFVTPAQVAPELFDRTLTLNGVSKAYAMTGFRIGYAGGPPELIKAMITLQTQSTSGASSVGQAAALAALTGPQDFIAQRTTEFQERRDIVVKLLNDIAGLTCHVPEGAFYLYPSCEGLIGRRTPDGKVIESDEDMVLYLLDAVGVAAVHGAAYGMSPYFRLSFAASLDDLREACARIQGACQALG